MARDRTNGRDVTVPSAVLDVMSDPETAPRRLPALFGLLDADDVERRMTGSWAVCLVVERHPATLPYAVQRLVDRLGDDAPIEVAHALDYLAARRPRDVDAAVTDLDEEREVEARRRTYRTGAGFARNEYLSLTPGERSAGRTRIPGESAASDPRRVYTREGGGRLDGRDSRSDRDGSDGDAEPADGVAAGPTDGSGDADADDPGDNADDGASSGSGTGRRTPTPGRLAVVSDRLSTVVDASRFDDLEVLTDRRRGRYGDVYRAVGTLDGEEYGVALTVFRLPDDDRASFARDLRDALAAWAAVDEHPGVRTVHDWGLQPRPWAALEYAELSLADRGDADVEAALWNARRLARAAAEVHQRGVVHGAIDPKNVVYYGNALTAAERQRPLLSGVGLGPVFARYGATENALDPRYAAPEHYEDRFGRVDHATDVYGLGALLYRLCTGEHPHTGGRDAVRESVVSGDPPSVTDAAPDRSIPRGIDEIVAKAMARRKLTRYETVNHLERELRGITDGG